MEKQLMNLSFGNVSDLELAWLARRRQEMLGLGPDSTPFEKPYRRFFEYSQSVRKSIVSKQRLHYILATTTSDTQITCDMLTSSNQLGVLAVVGHSTSEKQE